MDILVVEDNQPIREVLKKAFEQRDYSVDVAKNGEHGSALARKKRYGVVILDYQLPKKDGLQVCKEIRARGKNVPIILLSATSETKTKVHLLNAGADDYVTKPFTFNELLARIESLSRRPRAVQTETLTLDTLFLDSRHHHVRRGTKPVVLTRKEFMLLEFLMRHVGEVLSRTTLLDHVWDDKIDAFSNTVESHIANLRKKIDVRGHKKLIHTVSGSGYKIAA